jgi:hypothetical protein
MEPIKALVRLGERIRGPSMPNASGDEITPETIVRMLSDMKVLQEEISELRRWAKHIQIEVDDLREKI